MGRGKFGGVSEPAPTRIKGLAELIMGLFEGVHVKSLSMRSRIRTWLQRTGDALTGFSQFRPISLPQPGNVSQDTGKPRHPHSLFPREVSAGKEGFAFGGEKHIQGPTATPGHCLTHGHVDLVDIGTLFAIHLDGDETVVERCRYGVIFERLVCHDVAPMAGGIADGQKNRLILATRFVESRISPRIPVHRVVGMLQKIGALFLSKAIGHNHVAFARRMNNNGGK